MLPVFLAPFRITELQAERAATHLCFGKPPSPMIQASIGP
jgi:hypothetical protein